jgi:hypothetical protein
VLAGVRVNGLNGFDAHHDADDLASSLFRIKLCAGIIANNPLL